ncbi:hypothetical protein NC652_020265 [Populus alba x Populus x berolinensis]|nr:hypothetical protein NC652_020265 [Populus alba x Populus x berolinensis]
METETGAEKAEAQAEKERTFTPKNPGYNGQYLESSNLRTMTPGYSVKIPRGKTRTASRRADDNGINLRKSPPGVISMAMVCGGDDNVDYCEVPAGSRRQRAYFLCWPVIKKHFRETALIASWPNATSSISLSAHEEGGNKSIERAQSD